LVEKLVERDGKGAKDRFSMLPASIIAPLEAHLARVKKIHERDLAEGYGDVELPHALARKYPKAQYEWAWKFVFPSHKRSTHPKTGVMRDDGYFLRRLFLAISMTIAVHIAKRIVSAAIGAQIISKIPQFSNLTIGNDIDPCHIG